MIERVLKSEKLLNIFEYVVVATSLILMWAITVEILYNPEPHFSSWFVHLQLVVCIIYMCDFLLSIYASPNRVQYFWRHLIILVLSLPYLSLHYNHMVSIEQESMLVIALMPILRAFVAIYVILRWVNKRGSALRILYTYVLSLVSFTYISALLFYECELHINPDVESFGDALWWASMGLTTTELTVTPISVTAKVLAVALPLAGMLLLPIATNYLFSLRRR